MFQDTDDDNDNDNDDDNDNDNDDDMFKESQTVIKGEKSKGISLSFFLSLSWFVNWYFSSILLLYVH